MSLTEVEPSKNLLHYMRIRIITVAYSKLINKIQPYNNFNVLLSSHMTDIFILWGHWIIKQLDVLKCFSIQETKFTQLFSFYLCFHAYQNLCSAFLLPQM